MWSAPSSLRTLVQPAAIAVMPRQAATSPSPSQPREASRMDSRTRSHSEPSVLTTKAQATMPMTPPTTVEMRAFRRPLPVPTPGEISGALTAATLLRGGRLQGVGHAEVVQLGHHDAVAVLVGDLVGGVD